MFVCTLALVVFTEIIIVFVYVFEELCGLWFTSCLSSSDDEIKVGQDEGKAHYESVKLRQKKHDPFADLLSPQSKARLRWSQELNPLYDIIKGFKVSDGVKLYDTRPSMLLESSRASDIVNAPLDRSSYKTPSVIMEEELSLPEQAVSPAPSSLPEETSRSASALSDTTLLSPTHYSRKQHKYEDVVLLPDKPAGNPPLVKGSSLIQLMKRSVTEPVVPTSKRQGMLL